MTECTFEGCNERTRRYNLCNGHSQQKRAGRDLEPLRAQRDITARRDALKQCGACASWLPESDFYAHRRMRDGLSAACKPCTKAKRVQYREENLSKCNEESRQYYWNNRDERLRQSKAYRKKWVATPRGRTLSREQDHRRRARVRGAALGCWYARSRYTQLLSLDPCSYCGEYLPVEIDHIRPISISRDDSWSNLTPACRSCNASKGTKDLLGFLLGRST